MRWITRERVKVDRVACPWLIQKFIDPEAEFVFLPHDTDWSAITDGIVYDVPNCELGHHGEDVSFDSILKKHGIDDPALKLLAEIVRAADSKPPASKQAMGIGVQSLIRRIPVIIGPVVGGVLLDTFGVVEGVRIGVMISVVLGAAALLVQSRFQEQAAALRQHGFSLVGVIRRFNPELKRLLLSDILIRFCERIPFAWVVIYALDHIAITASELGLLIALEMATAIACYVPASAMADRFGKEPFVLATFAFFTLFPLSLIWARSFTALAAAFAIRGPKEFGEPARKALIISLARTGNRGQTIGAYYLVRDLTVTAGSFLGAALWTVSPEANFWSAFAVGAAGTLIYRASRPRIAVC